MKTTHLLLALFALLATVQTAGVSSCSAAIDAGTSAIGRLPAWGSLMLAVFGIAAGVSCMLLVRRLLDARVCKASRARDRTGANEAALVAQADGREIALGLLSKIHRFSIGSGPHAAIPLTGNGFRARHVALQRDGGMFRLRNRSRSPIRVNGVTVSAGGRCRLVLPADILINNSTKVSLRVRLRAGLSESDTCRGELNGHLNDEAGPRPLRRMKERSRLRTAMTRLFKMAITAFILTMAATVTSASPDSTAVSNQQLRVWVLLDTTPRTCPVATDMSTVAAAAVRALQPGDRLYTLSAHADRPRLRAMETIGPDTGRDLVDIVALDTGGASPAAPCAAGDHP